ncbi:MAG: hypothetical protein NVSMB65_12570 [Chloroflexota bacterium]
MVTIQPATSRGRLDPPRFMRAVDAGLRPLLPEPLRSYTFTARYRLAQVSYGMKGLHYEVWLHDATRHLEIGFHMEGDVAQNAALYDYLEDELLWLKSHLGVSLELERWDRGWCRLYRTFPLEPLTDATLESTCAYLARLIGQVQPLCQDWWETERLHRPDPRAGERVRRR